MFEEYNRVLHNYWYFVKSTVDNGLFNKQSYLEYRKLKKEVELKTIELRENGFVVEKFSFKIKKPTKILFKKGETMVYRNFLRVVQLEMETYPVERDMLDRSLSTYKSTVVKPVQLMDTVDRLYWYEKVQ